MKSGEAEAYNIFLHTGKVEDYLGYIDAKKGAQAALTAPDGMATGGTGAYYDRSNRPAGADAE